ncbi:MAG: hypothetical protein J5848_00340 [Bacteroidales bacterium]|nr:hypothetical protein [Bacteroidales bacterium]
MKKVLLSISAIAVVIMLASCGGYKSDAKKINNKMCKCAKIEDPEKKADCVKKLEELSDKLDNKYKENKEAQEYIIKTILENECLKDIIDINL